MGKVITFLGASLCLALAATAMAQTPPDAFKDVDRAHWAYDAVESLRQKGIVVGYPDGYFRGKRTLTRYEFAVALDRALKNIQLTPGPKGDKGDTGAAGAQGDAGPAGPPGMTPEEIETLRKLMDEFKGELASLGNNINAINARLDKLAKDVADVQATIAKMPKLSGNVFWGVRADSGNPNAVDRDGRASRPGQAVVHSFRLGVDANVAGGATVAAGLTVDNYKNYLGGTLAQVNNLAGSNVPADVRLDLLEVRTPFAGLGRGSSLTIGRFAERLGHLTLWKPDVDSYFNVPWVNDGAYRMDGARLTTHFGSLSTEVFAAQTSSVQGTDGNGPINNPLVGATRPWTFGSFEDVLTRGVFSDGKPIGMPDQGQGSINQLMGISAGLGIRQFEGGHVRLTALEAQTNRGDAAVLGSDFDVKVADRVSISGDYGRSVPLKGSKRFASAPGLDKDNNAFNMNVGYQSKGLGLTAGYRYIDPQFYSPGYWGKIGNWFNPTNVQGPTVRANYNLTSAVGVNVGGDFFSAAHDRSAEGGLGFNDDIHRILVGLRWDIAKNFQTTVDWEGVYWSLKDDGRFGGDPSGVKFHPTEHYITIGTGYNLTTSTVLKLMYQIGDFDGHRALFDGTSLRQNFNVFSTQVAVKF